MRRAAQAHLGAEGDRRQGLLARSTESLVPLRNPFLDTFGGRRWVQRLRKGASRDWLAWMLRRLDAPERVATVFGSSPPRRAAAERGIRRGGGGGRRARGGSGGKRPMALVTPIEPAPCRACRRRIEPCVTTCPYCYSDVRPWAARQAPVVVVGGVLLALFLAAVAVHLWTSVPP
jgi:hypothetical protein